VSLRLFRLKERRSMASHKHNDRGRQCEIKARRRRRAAGLTSPWFAAGAFVASTALAGFPTQASARDGSVQGRHRAAIRPPSALPEFAHAQAAPASQTGATQRFDIPAGPLSEVLAAFERATHVAVKFSAPEIGSIVSPGVTGTATNEQALNIILTGTGLSSRFTSPVQAIVEPARVTESVDVVARPAIDSPKYVVPVREVPQTIAIIPRTVMEQQAVTTLSDALRNVPGITLQAGEGGGASNTAGDMFNMRGFNASNSLFVDGVRDDGLVSRDVFNIEQVEVFMGPTGSDVGRGTAAGYVNMETKTPRFENAASGTVTLGAADQRRVTADLNHRLSLRQGDRWLSRGAVRLNALLQDSGVPGRDEVTLNSKAVAPSLALGLGTHTRVTAAGQFLRQRNVPDYGIPSAAWLDEPLAPTTVRAPRPVDQTNYYGSPAYDFDRGSQDSVTGRVEHDVTPRLTLRNQTRYNRAHREAIVTTIQNPAAYDPVTSLVTLVRQGNDRENTITSNQTSLTSRFATGRFRHAATAGVEVTSERQFAPTLTDLGTRSPVDLFNPHPDDPVVGYAPARAAANSTGRTTTAATYGFDTVDLAPRVQVSGGLRVERYDTSFRTVDTRGATTVDQHGEDTLVSGKAGLLFRAAQNGNVYASYGTSATPPGTANFALSAQPNNQNNPNVKPQVSTNYEIGSKWDFASGRLSLNTAVFHTINENVIFTVDATAIPPIFNQDDGQVVNGVTVGASGRLFDRLDLLANFGYLDTEQRSQNSANDGKRLTLTPKYSTSLWASYRLPAGFTLGGGVRATDDVFVNAANTIKSPGYHLADAMVEYAVNSHLTLRLNVSNLTNETYVRNVNNNGGRYNPGNPRAAVLTSKVRF
jgi:catecholate siderophore receptor